MSTRETTADPAEREMLRFRESLRHFPSGVAVVTIPDHDGVHGMTASSFTSVSLSPRLCSVSVNKPGRMHSLLSGTDGTFGISVLTDEQGGVADHFARRPWAVAPEMPTRRHSGTPVVAGALVWLICRKWAAYEGGDHTIFVGEVLDHGSDTDGGRAPLLHHNSTYHRLGTPMGAAALPADATAEGE